MAILYLNTHRGPTNSTQLQLLTTFDFFFFPFFSWLAVRFFSFSFYLLLLLLSFIGSVCSGFFFFSLDSMSLGTEKKKKKTTPMTGMGPTNSVKNIK